MASAARFRQSAPSSPLSRKQPRGSTMSRLCLYMRRPQQRVWPTSGTSRTSVELGWRARDSERATTRRRRMFSGGSAVKPGTRARKASGSRNSSCGSRVQRPRLAVAAIHRWQTWPDRLRLTGLDGRDIGVDLVAELTDGTLAAVQCKCYAETHTVGKKEIDSFLSASEAECFGHRWIVSTARPGPNAAAAVDAARPSVSWIDFRLYLDRRVDRAAEVRPVRELLPLQQEAVEVTTDGLAIHDRGTLVMACGTGKTFTALRIAEEIVPDGGTILFTAPSIALVSQARREWLRRTTPQHGGSVGLELQLGAPPQVPQDHAGRCGEDRVAAAVDRLDRQARRGKASVSARHRPSGSGATVMIQRLGF